MPGERNIIISTIGSPIAGHCQSISRNPLSPNIKLPGTTSVCNNTGLISGIDTSGHILINLFYDNYLACLLFQTLFV